MMLHAAETQQAAVPFSSFSGEISNHRSSVADTIISYQTTTTTTSRYPKRQLKMTKGAFAPTGVQLSTAIAEELEVVSSSKSDSSAKHSFDREIRSFIMF